MSYNWCHGPNCHTQATQSRVRGSGDNKVLRTVKIKQGRYNGYQRWHIMMITFVINLVYWILLENIYNLVIAIAPRRKALETPIKVEKEKYERTVYRLAR